MSKVKDRLKLVASALAIAFGACTAMVTVLAVKEQSDKKPPPRPPREAPEPEEPAIRTLPLELGEGDSRDGHAVVTDARGGSPTTLMYGTRVERLEERIDGPRGAARVRILSGPREGMIGWVPKYQIQAAR